MLVRVTCHGFPPPPLINVDTDTGIISLLHGNPRKRKINVQGLQRAAAGHTGWSERARETAPESYELLIPCLSDSWLPGLRASDASIWASETCRDKTVKVSPQLWRKCPRLQLVTSSNFLALYCSAPFRKFSKMRSQRTVPCKQGKLILKKDDGRHFLMTFSRTESLTSPMEVNAATKLISVGTVSNFPAWWKRRSGGNKQVCAWVQAIEFLSSVALY